MQWNPDRGTMEQQRILTTHQHSRVESSIPSHSVLPEVSEENDTACWSADGQLHSSCICQQKRGDPIFDLSSLGCGNMERLSTERHMDNSSTSSGSTER